VVAKERRMVYNNSITPQGRGGYREDWLDGK